MVSRAQRLVCIVRDTRTGSDREIPLAHDAAAWPHRVGSSPGCSIRIEDLPELAAEISGLSNHFVVRALAPVAIKAHGVTIAEGQDARFEQFSIGAYTVRMAWVEAA